MAQPNTLDDSTETDKLNASIESSSSDVQAPPQGRISIITMLGNTSAGTKLYILLGSIGAWVLGSLPPILFYLIGQIVDELSDEEEDDYDYWHESNKIAMFEIMLGLVALISGYVASFFFVRVGQGVGRESRVRYFQSILSKDIKYYDVNSKSAMEVPTDMAQICESLEQGTGEKFLGFQEVLMYVIVGFGISFAKSPQLFLIGLSLAPIDVLGNAFIGKSVMERVINRQRAYVKAGAISEEALMDIKTVHACNAQEYVAKNYNAELHTCVDDLSKNSLMEGIGWALMWSSWFSMGTVIYWACAKWISDEANNWIWGDDVEGADAVVVFWCMAFTCNILGNLIPGMMAVTAAQVSAFRMEEFIKTQVDFEDGKEEYELLGEIEFVNVQFSYPSKPLEPVLKGMSFHFEPLKSYAIVGESGAGKSTIIQLIERFYDIQGGNVLIDGRPIQTYKINSLRRQIGYVNQEPILFNLTIMQNIKLGNPNCTDDEAKEAARQANAYDFIMNIEGGFDANVGMKGSQVSGGQKQRIAIARAIIKKPKILLLDEATSALDNISEAIVLKALKEITDTGKMTVISVAQKLSTVRRVDKIVVMDNGVSGQEGTHKELINQPGIYQSMCQAQGFSLNQELASQRIEQSAAMLDMANAIPSKEESIAPPPPRFVNLPILRILSMAMPYWPLLVFGLIAAATAGICFPVFGYIVGKMTYYIVGRSGDEMEDNIRRFAMFDLLLVGVVSAAFFFMTWLFGMLTAYTTKDIRSKAFLKLLNFEAEFFDLKENNPTMLSQNLQRDTENLNSAGGPLVGVFLLITVALVAGCIISMIWQFYIGLFICCCIPLMMFAMIRGYMLHLTGISHPQHQAAQAMVLDTVINMKTVKAYGMEQQLLSKHEELIQKAYDDTWWEGHENGFYFGLGLMILYYVFAGSLWIGGLAQKEDKAGYEDILVAVYSNMMASIGIIFAALFSPGISEGTQAAKRIFELMDYQPKIDASAGGNTAHEVNGPIVFRDVVFKYAGRDNIILNKIKFTAERNQRLGITGTSGSGKTTIVQCILRFYDVTEGEVLINGQNIKDFDLKYLRRHIGIVGQEPVLFSGTLKHNIVFGMTNDDGSEISEDAIRLAMARAQVTFASNLEHDVGVRGSKVSGGQKQRIAIARAVLRNPCILILDEATSALDSRTEREIMQTLDEVGEGRTVIMIAHRLSTIQKCHDILVMEMGNIIQHGTHEELIRTEGHYSKLWNAARKDDMI